MKSSVADIAMHAIGLAIVVLGNLLILYVAVRVVRAAWGG